MKRIAHAQYAPRPMEVAESFVGTSPRQVDDTTMSGDTTTLLAGSAIRMVDRTRRALTAKEFRRIYGNISNTTFYSLVGRGELAVHKIGRRTYVDSAEAERFWASCAQGRR